MNLSNLNITKKDWIEILEKNILECLPKAEKGQPDYEHHRVWLGMLKSELIKAMNS